MIWFSWVLWHVNPCRSFNAKSFLYIYIKYTWFSLVGFYGISTLVGSSLIGCPFHMALCHIWAKSLVNFHINPCRSFNAKSFLYIYIKYMWFGLVGFYGISTLVGSSLIGCPFHMALCHIWAKSLVNFHINPCRSFNAKSFLYIYIKYMSFGLVGFYGVSTLVGHLMPNPFYTYILNIHDLVWLGIMADQPL